MLCVLLASLWSTAASGPPPWVVGTYAYPARDRAASIQPLADYVSRRSGHATRVRVFASPSALVDALRAGEVDVAVPNLHGFLQARQWPQRIAALPVPDVPSAQADRYRAVIVARDPVASLEMLQRSADRLALALVGPDSASGGFVPARALQARALDPAAAFASLSFAGSHAAALQALVDGEADVAALAADVHDRAAPEGLNVLWRSDPIPPGPLLCRVAAGVPCADIAVWLLEAHAHDAAVMAALRDGWPEFGDATTFREADLQALDALRDTR